MKATHIVEAALFSAGRPLAPEEIAQETGLGKAAVGKALAELQRAYAAHDTVLEVAKAGAKWAMQVRRQAAEPAARFAPMEIAPKLLKTLALIAYHQPLKQSELADMVGSKVYDHVPELKERGLIKTRQDGPTKILTTTAAFPEYFGLDAATPDEIRVALAKAVGLDPAAEARRAGRLEAFGEEPEAEAAGPSGGSSDGASEGSSEGASPPGAAGAPSVSAPEPTAHAGRTA